jgi:site-specific DNA-methyltransferase (adenine-specific)
MISEVYNDDCIHKMLDWPDDFFDIAIVDPPYGININKNMGRKRGEAKKHVEKSWDNSTPDKVYFDELFRVSKNQIIWGGNYFTEFLPPTRSWLFWDKSVPNGMSFSDGELAWTSFDRVLRKINVPYSGFLGKDQDGRIHPTQKPIALYSILIDTYCDKGDIILDTHLSSGSSRIAANELGYDFIGIELDKEYFDLSNKRFERYKKQGKLF